MNIGYLIRIVNDKLKAKADSDLAQNELTFTQSRVLGFLYYKGGTATQKEIEDSLRVSHPTVVGIIARLKEKDFVTCTVADNDKRNRNVSLTQKANKTFQNMGKFIEESEAKILTGLTDEQIENLKTYLCQIIRNLGEEVKDPKEEGALSDEK